MPKLPGKRGVMSQEEFKTIVEHEKSYEMKMLFVMLYLTGARLTEILELTREKINYTADGIMLVDIQVKKRKDRTLIFTHVLPINMIKAPYGKELTEFITAKNEPLERIWPFGSRKPQRHIRQDCAELGISPAAWCHLFRHTRLTRLARGGASAAQLQTWAGWTSLKYASVYIQQSPEMLKGLVVD